MIPLSSCKETLIRAMALQVIHLMLLVFLVLHQSIMVIGHGGMVEPPMRSIMWRYGFESPVNYDWNALYCGGRQNFVEHKGRCGICGDPVQGPFENDKGGIYDNGIIVRHYPAGLREIEVKVEITAHHKGFFQFKLCPNNEGPLTQDCLNRYPLPIQEGLQQGNPLRYYPPVTPKLNELHVALPPDVICDRCVLQWTYTAGNSVGQGADGRSCLGCGLQETFVNCADISIGGNKDKINVQKDQQPVGAVVEIASGPEATQVLDNAQPGANIADVLRELGVVFPGRQTAPGEHPTAVRPPPGQGVQASPVAPEIIRPRPNHNHPEIVRTIVDRSHPRSETNIRPVIPSVPGDGNMLGLPSTGLEPRTMARRPVIDIQMSPPDLPAPNAWANPDLPLIQRGRDFRQEQGMIPGRRRNHHIGMIGLNPEVNEIESRHQGETLSNALARGPHDLDTHNPFGIPNRDRHVSRGHARPKDTSLVDAVYALRDRIPQYDVFGNIRGYKPRTPSGHDLSSERKHLQEQYMRRLQKLGHDMHRSFRDHSDQYRDIVQSGRYPNEENYLYHQNKPELVRESAHEAPAFRHHTFVLPRRIMVHSVRLAKKLLRSYPRLRGRIFLSKAAHLKNKYARMVHKYARRQRRL